MAKQAGSFATLLSVVDKAGLTSLLEGNGPFTLFAPTDVAFENLPEGAVVECLADREKLTALVKYHLVPARVIHADVPARNGTIHVVDKVLLPSG